MSLPTVGTFGGSALAVLPPQHEKEEVPGGRDDAIGVIQPEQHQWSPLPLTKVLRTT